MQDERRLLENRLAQLLKATALATRRNQRVLDLIKTLRELARNEQAALAGGVASEAAEMDLVELRWPSPDDQYRAYVDLPPTPTASQSADVFPVRLAYAIRCGRLMIPGRPTPDFDGQAARLAGVSARVERSEVIKFPLSEFQTALQEGKLAVLEIREGSNLQTWLPIPPSS